MEHDMKKFVMSSLTIFSLSSIAFICFPRSAYAEYSCDPRSGNCCNIVRIDEVTTMNCNNPRTQSTWSQTCNRIGNISTCNGQDQRGYSWNTTCNRIGDITTCHGSDSDGNTKTWQP